MKRLNGAQSSCSGGPVTNLNIDDLENLSMHEVADAINGALL